MQVAMDLKTKLRILACLHLLIFRASFFLCMIYLAYLGHVNNTRNRHHRRRERYSMISRIPDQVKHMKKLVKLSDKKCITNLRMDRNAFARLCYLLQHRGGLTDEKYVSLHEQVAMFLSVLAHHKKNREIGLDFERSGHSVSKYFNRTLNVVLQIHELFLVNPEPVTADDDSETWKWFKGCLGALDGTYIPVRVRPEEKFRYTSRKGEISVNVLGVCDRNMKFVYLLAGWEGSAADSRVLQDALSREKGLRVPSGNYYLCDSDYTNKDGFLTPYRSKRYNLKEWSEGPAVPQDYQEIFNMKHRKARNVIERGFRLLKRRWGVLRSSSYYPIKIQNRIIMACALLHNYCRTQMPIDPVEQELDDEVLDSEDEMDADFTETEETSSAWGHWRDNLAQEMFNA